MNAIIKRKSSGTEVQNDNVKNIIKVLQLIEKKVTYQEISNKLGITTSTINNWKDRYVIVVSGKPQVVTPKKEKKVKKSKNTYTNADGVNKEVARNKMSKYIVDADVIGVIPTLPHIACTIEKKILLEQPNQEFIGVESIKETYSDMKKTIKAEGLPITPYNGKIGDKIYGKTQDTYAHLILDYCGCLPTFSKEIEYAISNKVVKSGGIIAITFGKPHRGKNDMTKFILSLGTTITNNPNDNRCQSDKATEAYFNRIIGDDFNFLEVFNYTDINEETGKGYPMTLIILKRS